MSCPQQIETLGIIQTPKGEDMMLVQCRLVNKQLNMDVSFPIGLCDLCLSNASSAEIRMILANAACVRIRSGEKPREEEQNCQLENAVARGLANGLLKEEVVGLLQDSIRRENLGVAKAMEIATAFDL